MRAGVRPVKETTLNKYAPDSDIKTHAAANGGQADERTNNISVETSTVGLNADVILNDMSPLSVHHVSSTSVLFDTFVPISRRTWQSRLQSL